MALLDLSAAEIDMILAWMETLPPDPVPPKTDKFLFEGN